MRSVLTFLCSNKMWNLMALCVWMTRSFQIELYLALKYCLMYTQNMRYYHINLAVLIR